MNSETALCGLVLAIACLAAGVATGLLAWRRRLASSALPEVAGWLIVAGLVVLGAVLPSGG